MEMGVTNETFQKQPVQIIPMRRLDFPCDVCAEMLDRFLLRNQGRHDREFSEHLWMTSLRQSQGWCPGAIVIKAKIFCLSDFSSKAMRRLKKKDG